MVNKVQCPSETLRDLGILWDQTPHLHLTELNEKSWAFLAIQNVGFTKKTQQLFSFIMLQNFQSFATCSSRTLSKLCCGLQETDWSWFTDILQGTCNKFIPLCFHSWLHSVPGGNQPQTLAPFPASAFTFVVSSTSPLHSSSTVILYSLPSLH